VNHIHGHISAAYLSHTDLKPPFLSVVVSGGHTCFYVCEGYNEFREIGGTRDDAAGEAFDKIGRVIGMPYPGGAALDRMAHTGNADAIKFPSPALRDSLDFSFSGIKTSALNYINSAKQKDEEICEADLAASYTSAIVSAIVKQSEAALCQTGLDTLVLSGGVAANSHLRAALEKMCNKKGARFIVPPMSLCGDNAAMIAASGYFEFEKGNFADTALNASACD